MKNNTLLFLLIQACFLMASCKKTDNGPNPPTSLPTITQEGKNTFGCMINGTLWVPFFVCNHMGPGTVELSYDIYPLVTNGSLPILFSMSAGNQTGTNSYFNFGQNGTLSDHIYGPGNIIDSLLISFIGQDGNDYYNYNYNYPGQSAARYFLVTKLDTTSGIISGIFSFTMYATTGQNQLDSIMITDGRFDFRIGHYDHCTQ